MEGTLLFLRGLRGHVFASETEATRGSSLPASIVKILNEEAHFQIISEWEHYGILALMQTKDFREDFHWIAKRLGIPEGSVLGAIEHLMRAGLIKVSGDTIKPAVENTDTTQDVKSAALRIAHKSTLDRAARTFDKVAPEDRCYVSNTIAIRKEKIKEAKKMIQEFRERFCEAVEEGERDEVYELAIQFFPLTQPCAEENE